MKRSYLISFLAILAIFLSFQSGVYASEVPAPGDVTTNPTPVYGGHTVLIDGTRPHGTNSPPHHVSFFIVRCWDVRP